MLSKNDRLLAVQSRSNAANVPAFWNKTGTASVIHEPHEVRNRDRAAQQYKIDAAKLVDTPSGIGNLVIENWYQLGMLARHIHQACLLDMTIPQAPYNIIHLLFEPQFVKMVSSLLIL